MGGGARLLIGVGSPLLGLGAGYVFFGLIYRYLPRVPVARSSVRVAALVSAVLWEVAKVAFGFFTRGLGLFSAYGPIAFAAGPFSWGYFSPGVLLFWWAGATVRRGR